MGRSFCCVGFGVRKSGNEGTIEQFDICTKFDNSEKKETCVMYAKGLQRRLLADCAVANTEYAGYLVPPHLRKKTDDKGDEGAKTAASSESTEDGVVIASEKTDEETKKKAHTVSVEEKKTLKD